MSFKIYVFCLTIVLIYCLPAKKQCKDLESYLEKNKAPDPKQLCEACYVAMPLARDLIRKNETKLIKEVITFICTYLKIEELNICSDAINLFMVIIGQIDVIKLKNLLRRQF